jgi:hypothetical protein
MAKKIPVSAEMTQSPWHRVDPGEDVPGILTL